MLASILPQRGRNIHSMWPPFLKTVAAAVLGLLCASPAFADDAGQVFGTLFGAGVGGLLGSTIGRGDGRVAVTGAGIFLGGLIGNELTRPGYGPGSPSSGPYYDTYSYDMLSPPVYYSYQPNYVALPSPPPPPPITYIDGESGAYCREYSETVRIGDHVQESYGTACLQPDGSWHVVQ
jgi:hypothetical protein